MTPAKIVGTAILAEPAPESGEVPVLFVTFEIDCAHCGKGTIALPGHHLRAMRDQIIEWCDRFPAHVGGERHNIRNTEFVTKGPGMDPSSN